MFIFLQKQNLTVTIDIYRLCVSLDQTKSNMFLQKSFEITILSQEIKIDVSISSTLQKRNETLSLICQLHHT